MCQIFTAHTKYLMLLLHIASMENNSQASEKKVSCTKKNEEIPVFHNDNSHIFINCHWYIKAIDNMFHDVLVSKQRINDVLVYPLNCIIDRHQKQGIRICQYIHFDFLFSHSIIMK